MSKVKGILDDGVQRDMSIAKFGYIEIYPKDLATKGLFYGDGFRIFIRAADVREVKYWSTINENDAIAVDDAQNYILTSCVEIFLDSKIKGSYRDICQEDRFQIILSIRDMTFPERECKISLNAECKTEGCGSMNIELMRDTIQTNELPDNLMSRYNTKEKCFLLETKSFGLIKLKSPTIGQVLTSTKLLKDARDNNKKFDATFISILPYLLTDNKTQTKEDLKKIENDFLSWNPKKLSFYIKIIEQLSFLNKNGILFLKKNCEKCGFEVSTPLTFPDGIKSLFLVQDWTSELL